MEFLHLKSSDGEIFTIPLDTARQFGPIRSMLEALGEDNINPDEVVPVPKVDAKTLSKVIGWARQHATGPDSKLDKASDEPGSKEESFSKYFVSWKEDHFEKLSSQMKLYQLVPEKKTEFSKSELEFIQVEANLLFDIALAANYLDVPRLLDLACQTIGNSIKRKTAQEMMETFDLVPQRRPRSETGAEKSNLSELPKRTSDDCSTTGSAHAQGSFEDGSFCFSCRSKEGHMKTCSRCKIVEYCSVECQKNHFPFHKEECKRIKKLSDDFVEEETKLKSEKGLVSGKMISCYEYYEGSFGIDDRTRNHCIIQRELTDVILRLGRASKSKKVLDMALSNLLEIFRLGNLIFQIRLINPLPIPACDIIPLILFDLDRDEDAYGFLKWFLLVLPIALFTWGGQGKAWKKGEWVFLKNQNMSDHPMEILLLAFGTIEMMPLQILVVLLLIKGRFVQKEQKLLQNFTVFQHLLRQTEGALTKVGPVLECIRQHVSSLDEEAMSIQRDQLDILISCIAKSNPYFFNLVLNPDKVFSASIVRTDGHKIDLAKALLLHCGHLILKNDVIMEIINSSSSRPPSPK